MKFQLDRDAFKNAISTVMPAVEGRSALPVLSHILLDVVGDTGLWLHATNLEVSIKTRVGCKTESSGSTTVPARLLSQFVGSLPQGLVTCELAERIETLKVSSGGMKANIKGIKADEFPQVVPPEGASITLPAGTLHGVVTRVMHACAKDDSRPVLHGALLEIKDGKLTMAAADGYRLAVHSIQPTDGQDWPDASVVVPLETLKALATALKDRAQMCTVTLPEEDGAHRVAFTIRDMADLPPVLKIQSQIIDGRFPPYEQIIPASSATWATVPTEALEDAVKTASLFNGGLGMVGLEFTADRWCIVRGSDKERGDSEAAVPLDALEGDGLSIHASSVYLLEALAAVPTAKVRIGLNTPSHPLTLRPDNDGKTDLTLVVMPMYCSSK